MAKRLFHWSSVHDCVMHETDGLGNALVEYTHEPSPYGPLISEHRDGEEYVHHYDALGSTTMLTDETGSVTDTFTYDAWGNGVARTGTTETPYRWVGKWGYQYDNPTASYYVRARTYQPTIARWTSVDPMGIDFATPLLHAIQIYLYGGNGVDYIDPSGWQFGPPPSDPLLHIAYPCDHFTVSEWGTDLCNWGNRPGVVPRGFCQHCKCSDMKDANIPMSDAEIFSLFRDTFADLFIFAMVSNRCNAQLAIRDSCSPRGFAVTCEHPSDDLGPHIICVPRSLKRCDIGGLIAHEMLHVMQLCQGRRTGARRLPPRRGNYTCEELEREAYQINCRSQILHDCFPPPDQAREIRKCVTNGVRNSCHSANRANFGILCNTLRNELPASNPSGSQF